MHSLNEVFSSLSLRRRYEVWFLRLGLADGSGAWWFRYLLMNPGRGGCGGNVAGMPAQVWGTWFPAAAEPRTLIQGFSLSQLELSEKGTHPFHLRVGDQEIGENSCKGSLESNGHSLQWSLRYRSTFRATLSSKGWIGFSRTPHSDAIFDGEITLDGHTVAGTPLGFGVQGHNCGYRHRNFWRWTHCYFLRQGQPTSTLEALVYEMPFGLTFRRAVLWHDGEEFVFRKMRETTIDRDNFRWHFSCPSREGFSLDAAIGGTRASTHHLPYLRTNCDGSFDVANNSLATASVVLRRKGGPDFELSTKTGAVLEMVG